MYFSDRMTETNKEEIDLEEFEIKEEINSFKEEILLSSTVEETCTVNLHKYDKKMENIGTKGKL